MRYLLILSVFLLLAAGLTMKSRWFDRSLPQPSEATSPETSSNPIQIENIKPGSSNWVITKSARHHEIEGFASATSVEAGETIGFYINSQGNDYNINIYRMGWYQGLGAREVLLAANMAGQDQPPCEFYVATGLISCADWSPSFTLHVPSDWLSGVYFAKLTTVNSQYQSYIIFLVRNDTRQADIFFQTAVATYQAYNAWGGKSLYGGDNRKIEDESACESNCRAAKVSSDRPFDGDNGAGQFLNWEYPMVRWLEREGYDVAYGTDVDVHESSALLLSYKVLLIAGHDEYWSRPVRDHVQGARDHGVSLAIFGANTAYWQIRLEDSPVGRDHVIVCYRDTKLDREANPGIPDSLLTIRWRDKPLNEPENALLGIMYESIVQPPYPDMVLSVAHYPWFASADIVQGSHFQGLVGYEYDNVCPYQYEQAHQPCPPAPPGLTILSDSPLRNTYGRDSHSNTTIYRATSGAYVFAAGTIQWSWGLDDFGHPSSTPVDPRVQQLTLCVLNRMIGQGCTSTYSTSITGWYTGRP